jgi:pimeloyl-ACP methyl ester carboxylesterase
MVKESWSLQSEDLSKHFEVISFDNRGVGESTVPTELYTIADMASDTVGLMDALGIDSAHIFGVSMGGLIAQVMALDYPHRVKKVALGCTTHGGRHAVQPEKDVMAILAQAADPNTPQEVGIRKRASLVLSEGFQRNEPEKAEWYVKNALKHAPTLQGAKGQMKALGVFNVKERLGDIHCPVLLMTGDEDRMIPPENSRLLAKGIPGAELCVVKGAGHSFYFERPEEVNRILIDFFTK